MKCRDFAKKEVRTCSTSTSSSDCARMMKDHDIGFVPVTDDSEKLVGTVTDRDLCVRVLGDGKSSDVKIGDIMSSGAITCSPDDDLKTAERKMAENQISRLIVTDKDRCIGIISMQDIVQSEDDARRAYRVERAIKSDGQSQIRL